MLRLCFLILEALPQVKTPTQVANRPFSLVSAHIEVVKTITHLADSKDELEALLGSFLDHLDGLRAGKPGDNDLVVKEVRKHWPSLPAGRRPRARGLRSGKGRNARPKRMHSSGH